jgi:hypothetical protein
MLSLYPSRDLEDMHILWGPHRLHQLSGAVTTPLFRHLGLSSWHSADGAIVHFFKFGPAGQVLFAFVRWSAVAMACYVAALYWRWYRSPARMRRRRTRSMEKVKSDDENVV